MMWICFAKLNNIPYLVKTILFYKGYDVLYYADYGSVRLLFARNGNEYKQFTSYTMLMTSQIASD